MTYTDALVVFLCAMALGYFMGFCDGASWKERKLKPLPPGQPKKARP